MDKHQHVKFNTTMITWKEVPKYKNWNKKGKLLLKKWRGLNLWYGNYISTLTEVFLNLKEKNLWECRNLSVFFLYVSVYLFFSKSLPCYSYFVIILQCVVFYSSFDRRKVERCGLYCPKTLQKRGFKLLWYLRGLHICQECKRSSFNSWIRLKMFHYRNQFVTQYITWICWGNITIEGKPGKVKW